MEKKQGIGFFERYLTIWVALCIVIGMAIGQYLPAIPQTLSKFEYANVSIPVAILIWLMIYPMMLKVDFQSIKNVGKRPKGIIITCITNWLIIARRQRQMCIRDRLIYSSTLFSSL